MEIRSDWQVKCQQARWFKPSEGPLFKQNENGSSSSFILSSKTSYLDKTSKTLYSYISDEGLPYSFWIFMVKLLLQVLAEVNLMCLDLIMAMTSCTLLVNYSWNSYGFGSNFILIPSGSSMLVEGILHFLITIQNKQMLELNLN